MRSRFFAALLAACLLTAVGCRGEESNPTGPASSDTAAVTTGAPETEPEAKGEIDVIVLAGQSNAVGVGHTAYLTQHFQGDELARLRRSYKDVRIRFFAHNRGNTKFERVSVGQAELNRDTFGPEVGMADYLSQTYPGRQFIIVKYAVGSTTLAHDWAGPEDRYVTGEDGTLTRPVGGDFDREAGWCLDGLYALLDESLAALEADGYEPVIRGFCWMQGEGDAITDERTEAYPARYQRMIGDFGEKYASYLERCTYVDGGISTVWKNYQAINDFKRQYAAESEDRVFIDTIAEGLTTHKEPEGAPDIYHYDSDSVVKLGRLFASALRLEE